jgi:hypothetical protein
MTEQGRPPTEEELRAAYEAQLKQLRVDDVVLQTIVSLIPLGGRRAGLAPGTEGEADPAQLRLAIDAARALLPLVEEQLGPDATAIREALSQLQLAYARNPAPGGPTPPAAGEQPTQPQPGPARSSGRLWVPGS